VDHLPRRYLGVLILPILLLFSGGPASQGRDEDRVEILRQAIEAVKGKRLYIGEATPHEIAMGVFAFGKDFRVYERNTDTFVNAVEYLLEEATYRKKRIFGEKEGEVFVVGPTKKRGKVQDLPDQILMVLALAGQKTDAKIVISEKKEVTLGDLLETSKKHLDPRQEMSCSLVAFAQYLRWEDSWKGTKVKTISLDRLVKATLERNSAKQLDDGAYHLFALAQVLRKEGADEALDRRVRKVALERLVRKRNVLKSQQTAEGSLGFLGDKALETTSRHLNWIVISGPWKEVHQPWIDRAAFWLAKDLQKAVLKGKVSYGTLAMGARSLQEYMRLRYPEPEPEHP
jgi:hypothetical protein